MYSEGSDVVPQSNETALQYFKKAADMVWLSVSWNYSMCTKKLISSEMLQMFHVLFHVHMTTPSFCLRLISP